MRSVLVLFLLNTIFSASGQTTSHKIVLDKYVEDEKGKKLQSVIAVYRYRGQPFEDPINLGVATKKESGHFYAKLPDLTNVRDTNYAYIYFGGLSERKELKGYVLAIVGNNTRRVGFPSTLIWIDRNYNLDLTDDGPPDTFGMNTMSRDITFVNPQVKNATYTVIISRFPFDFNRQYISMLNDYYNENKGTKEFAGALFSFREQRINTIAGDYKEGNDSFRIGIKDVNCDGLYNGVETDYILVGDYKAPVLPDVVIPIKKDEGKTFFEHNGKRYIVEHIDHVGAYITVRLDENARITGQLQAGKKIRKFKFWIAGDKDKKTISIRKYRKKPTYIYVWRFDQPGFAADTAALRVIAGKYGNKVNLVTLNYGETPNVLKGFLKRNNINWTVGQSTLKINKLLYIEKYPTGILTKKHLKVDKVGLSPSELLTLLNQNLI